MLGQLSEKSKEKVAARLFECEILLAETTAHIRDVMSELRPHMLDDYGLIAALRWYGERQFKRSGIQIEVTGEELNSRPPQDVETALFRIAQEAITNVVKHARASRVSINLKEGNNLLRLTIKDDGVGFDLAMLPPENGSKWGLITMRERAQAHNRQVSGRIGTGGKVRRSL